MVSAFKRWLKTTILSLAIALLFLGIADRLAQPASASLLMANLPAGDAITDGKAILRYALPIKNDTVRELQKTIEDMSSVLRISRRKLTAVNGNLKTAERILTLKSDKLLASVPADRQPQAEELIHQMVDQLTGLRASVEAQDKEAVWAQRSEFLTRVGQLEELMVTGFPYEVPEDYSYLPQLKGRATIAVSTSKGDLTVVVDGYSAPVSAGNFVDLVQRGFYDGLPFIRAEDNYVLQTGDPDGPETGFIDPTTKTYRAVPLEVLVAGDEKPVYGITLEEAGRYLDNPALPFSAYGALAMARPADDPNGGSSQFFFFLFERELTPPGFNLLDGRYSVFGYVTDGNDVLEKLKQGDRIDSMRVVSGAENLVQPSR